MRANWYLDNRVYYYMQMVIPSIFSIDPIGWCASASNWPIDSSDWTNSITTPDIFEHLAKRIDSNESKFKQPEIKGIILPDKFVLFPCQIPHDETIKYHSDVSVADSLDSLIAAVLRSDDFSLVVKGHPANLDAMKSLKEVFYLHKKKLDASKVGRLLWIDQASIHELIQRSAAVFTVNSGVGLEALLHSKLVFTFGNADYSSASEKIVFGGSVSNGVEAIQKILVRRSKNHSPLTHQNICRRFINSWYYSHYDCDNLSHF